MPRETENWIYIPNPKQKRADFDPKWYRGIVLDEAKGIRALLQRLKSELPKTVTRIRDYMFDKRKDWTMAKAQAWVKEHTAEIQGQLEAGQRFEEFEVSEQEGFFKKLRELFSGFIHPDKMKELEDEAALAMAIMDEDGDEFATRVDRFVVNGIQSFPVAPKETPWTFSVDEENAILGPDGNDWGAFASAHLLVDISEDELPNSKGFYQFPVAKIIDGQLTYVWAAVKEVFSSIHGAKGWEAQKEVKAALHATLKDIYEKFDETIPPLSLFSLPEEVDFFALKDEKLEEHDGLVWKQTLRVGSWPGEMGRGPIKITLDMLEDMKKSFDGRALPNVQVPTMHTDQSVLNSGCVEAVEVRKNQKDPRDDGLWVGIKFTEPEIEDQVRRGTIANVSAAIKQKWQDVKTGKLWEWVLWHVALTNLPLVPELKPFLHSIGCSDALCHTYSMQEVNNMGEEELQAQLEAEKTARAQSEQELSAEKEKTQTLTQEIAGFEKKAHEMEVGSILLALQGKGKHDKVTLPENCGFAPTVLGKVQPILEADQGEGLIKLALGADEKKSVTEVVLSILNSIGECKDGALISYSSHGDQEHKAPGTGEKSEAEKDKEVDEYLQSRNLSIVEEAK